MANPEQFNEQDVVRDQDGKFGPKVGTEVEGGTDSLAGWAVVSVSVDESGTAYVDTEDMLFDGPVRVAKREGRGGTSDVYVAEADVHLDMAGDVAHRRDCTRDEAEEWLTRNQDFVDAHLKETYGANLDPGADAWGHMTVNISRSTVAEPGEGVLGPAFALSDDKKVALMDNALNGGYQTPNFYDRMIDDVEDRQVVTDDGELTDRAFEARSYNDSPVYAAAAAYGKPTRIHPPVMVRDASGNTTAFDDLPAQAQVSYADAWSNGHDSALAAIGNEPQDWRKRMLKDRQSESVRRLVNDADETTRAQAAAMRRQGRDAGIAAAQFRRELGPKSGGSHTVTVVDQADRIRNNRLRDHGRDEARTVHGVSEWRQSPDGSYEGHAGDKTIYFDATDVVDVREAE